MGFEASKAWYLGRTCTYSLQFISPCQFFFVSVGLLRGFWFGKAAREFLFFKVNLPDFFESPFNIISPLCSYHCHPAKHFSRWKSCSAPADDLVSHSFQSLGTYLCNHSVAHIMFSNRMGLKLSIVWLYWLSWYLESAPHFNLQCSKLFPL